VLNKLLSKVTKDSKQNMKRKFLLLCTNDPGISEASRLWHPEPLQAKSPTLTYRWEMELWEALI